MLRRDELQFIISSRYRLLRRYSVAYVYSRKQHFILYKNEHLSGGARDKKYIFPRQVEEADRA